MGLDLHVQFLQPVSLFFDRLILIDSYCSHTAYLDFLAFRRSTGLLRALLPLFGFAPFDPVDSKFDAGGRMLGGGI